MDKDRQKEIAAAGGRAAHKTGLAHEFTAEEARAAGKKGGDTTSQDRAHMAAIGRKGGLALKGRKRTRKASGGEVSRD